MDLGVALPTSGAYAPAEAVVRVAQGAERLGCGTPLTADDLDGERPFLGGSAWQIAADLDLAAPLGLDHVLFADTASTTADELLRRLSELREAVPSAGWRPAA
ncbi:hypothetical protein GCM10010412_069290 [Nonomuraea recticatena]|uniref:Luciferase-like monooxygenase n=1 Tax=Nonomuraea recticatena TaxID=46178 RepID=A0ABP6F7H7_9ACTN